MSIDSEVVLSVITAPQDVMNALAGMFQMWDEPDREKVTPLYVNFETDLNGAYENYEMRFRCGCRFRANYITRDKNLEYETIWCKRHITPGETNISTAHRPPLAEVAAGNYPPRRPFWKRRPKQPRHTH